MGIEALDVGAVEDRLAGEVANPGKACAVSQVDLPVALPSPRRLLSIVKLLRQAPIDPKHSPGIPLGQAPMTPIAPSVSPYELVMPENKQQQENWAVNLTFCRRRCFARELGSLSAGDG